MSAGIWLNQVAVAKRYNRPASALRIVIEVPGDRRIGCPEYLMIPIIV